VRGDFVIAYDMLRINTIMVHDTIRACRKESGIPSDIMLSVVTKRKRWTLVAETRIMLGGLLTAVAC
jgi:hypothetical protein